MDAQDIDILDLETSSFDLPDDPSERAGGISAGEDVLVHEETPGRGQDTLEEQRDAGYTPDEVFVLPGGSDTSDLEDKDTVVFEKIIHLTHE